MQFLVISENLKIANFCPGGSGDKNKQKQLPGIFRKKDGRLLRREEVQELLGLAALAAGISPDRMGSHSLRIGGATALFHATGSVDVVKRFGRWVSSAFQGYLWESDDHARGVSSAMAKHNAKLWAEHGLGAEAAAAHYGDGRPT